MTTGATGQLGLALPVQGELSGTWGDTVNNGITQYTNIAIAATLTLTNDGAVTLQNTTGDASASNIVSSLTGAGTVTAQFAIVKVTGTLTTPKIITAPSYSKTYVVVNAATGSTVSFIRSGQTPAVSIAVGESAFVYYNGTDYVKVSSTVATGVTSFTAGTTGLTPNTATTGAVTLAGTLATANGGTNLGGATPFTSGGVVYASSTSALATGSALTFDGTNLGVGVTPAAWFNDYRTIQLSGSASLSGRSTATDWMQLMANVYRDAAADYLYVNTAPATQYQQNSGNHVWYNAPSGTAGNVIPFTAAMFLNASGNLGIGTTSPTNTLHLKSETDANIKFEDTTSGTAGYVGPSANNQSDTTATRLGIRGEAGVAFSVGSATKMVLDSVGNVLIGGTAARGTTAGAAHLDLFNGTAPAGTLTNGISLYSDSGDLKFMNAAGTAFDVGYRNIPQNAQGSNYTLTLADAGKHIYRSSGSAATWTIPANSSVAYPVGTAITFINLSATAVSIAITTDTMYLSSAGTTGTRTLAQYGSATAIKFDANNWLISGSGLT